MAFWFHLICLRFRPMAWLNCKEYYYLRVSYGKQSLDGLLFPQRAFFSYPGVLCCDLIMITHHQRKSWILDNSNGRHWLDLQRLVSQVLTKISRFKRRSVKAIHRSGGLDVSDNCKKNVIWISPIGYTSWIKLTGRIVDGL